MSKIGKDHPLLRSSTEFLKNAFGYEAGSGGTATKAEIEQALYAGKRLKRAPIATEAEVLKSIQEYAQVVLGITLHRRNTGAFTGTYKGKKRFVRFSQPGMADLWGIVPPDGRACEIEVKRRGEIPTVQQSYWLEDCRQAGAIAFYADSLDDFIEQWTEYMQRG